MLKRREIEKIRITFNGFFLKNSKSVIFRKSAFLFDSMSEDFSLEQKTMKNTKMSPTIRRKTLQDLIFILFLSEHVKSLRQQCSWLDQKKLVIFSAESVFFRNDRRENQLFSELIQHCSEFIRVYSTEQNKVSSFSS